VSKQKVGDLALVKAEYDNTKHFTLQAFTQLITLVYQAINLCAKV
jgi:hypothetical protein